MAAKKNPKKSVTLKVSMKKSPVKSAKMPKTVTKAVKPMKKSATPMKKSSVVKKSISDMLPGMPKVGDAAPDFQLPDQHGHRLQLSQMRGNTVLIYFYPKDDTPGCTLEAQGFNNDIKEFQKKGVMVFGISKDNQQMHQKFIGKYGLKFQLLSDVDGKIVQKYGCWVEKSMYGKKYMGIQRATFLIDAKGKVKKVWPKVTPEGHSKEILAVL